MVIGVMKNKLLLMENNKKLIFQVCKLENADSSFAGCLKIFLFQ